MIVIYHGPMFSGKTSILCHELETMADLGRKVIGINHSSDIRLTSGKSDTVVTTHGSRGLKSSGKVRWISAVNLSDVDVSGFQVIGIDECQFFTDLVATASKWAKEGKTVICSGLDGNFRQEPIGQTLQLIPWASKAVKLNAKCHRCLETGALVDAPFTRKRQGQNDKEIDIGGAEKYEAVCMKHLEDEPKRVPERANPKRQKRRKV